VVRRDLRPFALGDARKPACTPRGDLGRALKTSGDPVWARGVRRNNSRMKYPG